MKQKYTEIAAASGARSLDETKNTAFLIRRNVTTIRRCRQSRPASFNKHPGHLLLCFHARARAHSKLKLAACSLCCHAHESTTSARPAKNCSCRENGPLPRGHASKPSTDGADDGVYFLQKARVVRACTQSPASRTRRRPPCCNTTAAEHWGEVASLKKNEVPLLSDRPWRCRRRGRLRLPGNHVVDGVGSVRLRASSTADVCSRR